MVFKQRSNKRQGFHQKGIREGLTTYYYEDGTMQREGFFKEGLPDGMWTYWNKEGKKILILILDLACNIFL